MIITNIGDPLAKRLLRTFFAVYLLMIIVTTISQMAIEYYEARNDSVAAMSVFEQVYKERLTHAVSNLNFKQITLIANDILQNPTIVGVRIAGNQESNFKPVNIGLVPSDPTPESSMVTTPDAHIATYQDPFVHRFNLQQRNGDSWLKLGQVALYSNATVLLHRLAVSYRMLIIAAVLQIIVVWLLIYYVIRVLSTLFQQHLTENHAQLIATEKMAELGRVVPEVTHDINTPLGISLTGITYFHQIVNKLQEAYKADTLEGCDFEKFIDDSKQLARSIQINLERAAQMISSFQLVAVDQVTEDIREFNVRQYVDEILFSLSIKLRKRKHHIIVDCDPAINIENYPGALSQIITNFVTNSLKHAFAPTDVGEIRFKIEKHEKMLVFTYSDNGKGINDEELTKVFDPFFTTAKDNGGTGLGLHIVYNIVTQKLKGRIEVKSQLDDGTQFIVTFPAMVRNLL